MVDRLYKARWCLPFIVGILLVVSKFSENSNRLPWSQLGQGILFAVIVASLGMAIFYAMPITRKASPVISAVFVVVTMMWMVFPITALAVGVMLVLMVVFIYLKPKALKFLSAFAVLIVATSLFVAFWASSVNLHQPMVLVYNSTSIQLAKKPDIYFIVPDRFCSHEGLLELCYNNSDFIDYLRVEGFYVNEGALSRDPLKQTSMDSDTTRTARFLASVMNLGEYVPLNIPYNEASKLIKYHKVGRILKANGYTYHHIGDWWAETETNPLADVNYVYHGGSFMPNEELSMVLMDRSIFRYLTTYFWHDLNVNRARHLFQMESFKQAIQADSPKFVFVHTLLPHPPFVWAADGTPQEDDLSPTEAYIEQVKFCERFLEQFIEAIPEDSVIIIQSDEGLCFTDRKANFSLSDTAWYGVLSVWRIPGIDNDELGGVEITEVLSVLLQHLEAE